MKKMTDMTLFERTLIGMIILTVVLVVVLFFVTGNENGEVLSLSIGAILIVVLEYYHIHTLVNISKNKPQKLKSFTLISYFLKFLIIIGVVFLGYKLDRFNFIYIIFGIALYPTMNLISTLTYIKGE